MNEIDRRKAFQRVKGMTNEQFWNWMNLVHSQAYFKAVQHYEEAAAIVLPPRQQKQLKEKAAQIREQWDGMATIDMDETEAAELLGRPKP
jgi:hypothetical protein